LNLTGLIGFRYVLTMVWHKPGGCPRGARGLGLLLPALRRPLLRRNTSP
jgi:hypothetical protein